MGVTLQQHRAQIGIFDINCQKLTGGCKYKSSGIKARKSSRRMDVKLVLLLVLLSFGGGPTSINENETGRMIIETKSYNYLPSSVQIKDVNFESKYKYGNRQKTGIKIMHWNAGGKHLINKITNIESVINGYKPSILGISESNFFARHDINDVQIENYKLFLSETINNENIQASRIAVYVHNDIACKLRKDLMNDTFSSIWLEVNLPRQRKFLVCQAYRDWQYMGQADNESKSIQAQCSRWVEFIDQWEKALQTDLECLVVGDLNIDHTKWTNPNISKNSITYKLKPLIDVLFNRILPYGAAQCMVGPTRFESGNAASGLDHFWTNKPNKLSEVHAYFQGSDHKVIIGTRYTKSLVRNPRFIKKRSYKNFQPNEFLKAMRETSWWDLYSCEDPEKAVEIFTQKMTLILDDMAPVKKYQVRSNYAPWLTSKTKDLMNERDLAQKTAAETGNEEDWKKFKVLRNQINGILKKEKRDWQASRLENCATTSDIWKTVKSWLGWNTGGTPTQLVVNGELVNKPKQLSKCMNEFFVNKVTNLRGSIPPCRKDPLDRVRNLMQSRNCSFSLRFAHPDDISKVIKNLKSSKSSGLDDIDSYVLKLACEEVTPAITHIVNLSIGQSYFPTFWKTSKVIPLFKKGDKTIPKNYRPVSLLPITSKILERVVYEQLVKYLEDNCILHPSHHGFRKNHSTTTALLEMYSSWVDAYEQDKVTAVVLLDMSAAFDLVDKTILIEKLKLYGLDSCSSAWMESYLSSRSQQVFLDGELSDILPVNVGVPQGSILGPILYCLMVNDFPEVAHNHPPADDSLAFWNTYCSNCGGISCFADDSSFSKSNKDTQSLNEELKVKYKEISEYMASNRLVLNSDKTHLLVMASTTQHRLYDNYEVELDTGLETILPQNHERLLGCEISSNFKWNEHIKDNELSLHRQLTSRINALQKISYAASFSTRKMIANGIVISRIIYAIQLWGGANDYLLKILQVLQNRAARFVTRLDIYTSQRVLLLQCGWMSVKQLAAYHSLVLVYKTKTEQKPVFLAESLSKPFQIRTRAASTGALVDNLKTTSEISKLSFISISTKLWNTLPPQIRQAGNLQKFKFQLKVWVKVNVSQ